MRLHIDCHLYSSLKIKSKIVKGTIIVFDKYFNSPGWGKGKYLAIQE